MDFAGWSPLFPMPRYSSAVDMLRWRDSRTRLYRKQADKEPEERVTGEKVEARRKTEQGKRRPRRRPPEERPIEL